MHQLNLINQSEAQHRIKFKRTPGNLKLYKQVFEEAFKRGQVAPNTIAKVRAYEG